MSPRPAPVSATFRGDGFRHRAGRETLTDRSTEGHLPDSETEYEEEEDNAYK
jgi:hypothetical protein